MNEYYKKWYDAMMSDEARHEEHLAKKRERSKAYYIRKTQSAYDPIFKQRMETADTVCKRCVRRKLFLDGRCHYEQNINDERTSCSSMELSAYWRNIERKEENERRIEAMFQRLGVRPRFKVGDKVWYVGKRDDKECPMETSVRKIIVHDSGDFCYKVHGSIYECREGEVFCSPRECVETMIERVISSTRETLAVYSAMAEELGIELSPIEIGIVDAKHKNR